MVWIVPAAVLVAGTAYLASNSVPPTSAGDRTLAAAKYTYDNTSTSLHYTGTWDAVGPTTTALTSGAYDHTIAVSTTPTAALTVTFTGVGIEWIGSLLPDGGTAKVILDGNTEGVVNTFTPTTSFQQYLYTSPPLGAGHHKLVIEVQGGAGSVVSVDAINVDQ